MFLPTYLILILLLVERTICQHCHFHHFLKVLFKLTQLFVNLCFVLIQVVTIEEVSHAFGL
jgi:hypothetical protein